MNRKKQAKINKKLGSVHIFDETETWLRGDFRTPPWPQDKIDEFQKRLDSAFGGENAIVLAWSGDRKYGDIFLNEKGEPEQKPVLLFSEHKVNETDYIYVTCPRWLLLEVNHGSQLEASWEAASIVYDQNQVPRRIRPEKPPKYFYTHLRIIADHDPEITRNGIPPCCEQKWMNGKRICYGKYREPNDTDIAFVGRIREQMDRDGIAQRNDTARDPKVLLKAKLATNHFIKQSQLQQAMHTKDVMLANPGPFFQSILDRIGSTMSPKERDKIVKSALDQQDEERFSK